jgi:hypothetical protein
MTWAAGALPNRALLSVTLTPGTRCREEGMALRGGQCITGSPTSATGKNRTPEGEVEVAGVEPASWSVDQEPLQVYPPVSTSAKSVGGGVPLPAKACFSFPARAQAHARVSPGLLQAPPDARDHAPETRGRYYAASAKSALLAVFLLPFLGDWRSTCSPGPNRPQSRPLHPLARSSVGRSSGARQQPAGLRKGRRRSPTATRRVAEGPLRTGAVVAVPYLMRNSRSSSRFWSLFRMSSRLSKSFFPRAIPSSHFTIPRLR